MMSRKRHSKRPLWQHGTAGGLVLSCFMACAPHEEPDACPLDTPTPPFRLTVDTTETSLSPELEIRITFGGNQTETYHPGETSASPDICCATFDAKSNVPERIPCSGSATDSATEPNVVVCDLWTGGAANLTISGGAVTFASQTLQAVPRVDIAEQCGLFETLEASWTYGLNDAGVVAIRD